MAPDPGFVAPTLATLVDDPVDGEEWIFEPKLDGIRLIVVRDGDRVRLWSRNEKNRTEQYPEIADALLAQPCERFVVDGEVVAFDGSVTSFSRLQTGQGRRYLYLFDAIRLGDDDLRSLPLRERKSRLRSTIDFDDPIRFCTHRNGGDGVGPRFLEEACRMGWEGLIAKRADGPYRSGRSRDWLKLKCVAQQEFVIGGYTDPRGSRTGLGALLVGYHDDGVLRFAGRVGTGFDDKTLRQLSSMLADRERETSPFDDAPAAKDVHWVTPDLVCQVGFTEWTTAGRLRHPRYLGLRDDKDPGDVVRETPRATS